MTFDPKLKKKRTTNIQKLIYIILSPIEEFIFIDALNTKGRL